MVATILNPQQQAAVKYGISDDTKSPLLIIAGAGTGKTNTLAHKTAELIINNVSPDRILLVTFARRAASELSSRASRIVEQQQRHSSKTFQPVKISWMGTFHSIANRLLRTHATAIGLDPDFVIMDRSDSADLIDLCRHELQLSSTTKRFPKKNTCLNIYSRCLNAQQALSEVLERYFPYCRDWETELTQLFSTYTKAKMDQVCLDYDDLLLYCFHMAQVPQIAQAVRKKFDYILVDEYQDTNVLQAGMLTGFFPTGEGLTVVGDDAQSIYSFRSATVDNILGFPNLFTPKAKVISLTQNYRSHQKILDLSNALLSEGSEGYKVELYSDKKTGIKPKLVTVENDAKQAEYIVEQVLAAREEGIELKKQAVLFRSSYHSDRLELELTRRNIPFVKHGGLKFLEASHVKDLLSIIRWADNPKFRISAFRVLKLLPGVGPKIADKIFLFLEVNQFDLASLKQFKLPEASQEYFSALSQVLEAIHNDQIPWTDQVNSAAKVYKDLLEINYDDHFVRFGDVEQLAQISQQYSTRERFLSELTLDPPQKSSDLAGPAHIDDDFLILSTVHSAKGQEWQNVHVLNVADGNFPNEYAIGDKRAVEEERRLLNVAITRAKNELHLIQPLKYWVPEQQKHGDRHVYGGKSRFLTDNIMPLLEVTHYPKNDLTPEEIVRGNKAISDIRSKILGIWES
jgi:DNA helicase-2/ATP-dependent DNA helicase PcrA